VAERVVDRLEVVQIDQQDGDRLRIVQRRRQFGAEQRAIGQPRQPVVGDLVLQPLLGGALLPQQPGVLPEGEELPDRDQHADQHGGQDHAARRPVHRADGHGQQRHGDGGESEVRQQLVVPQAGHRGHLGGLPLCADREGGQHRRRRHDQRLGRHPAGVTEPDGEDRDRGGGQPDGRDQPHGQPVHRAGAEVRDLRDATDGQHQRQADQHHRLAAPRFGGGEHRREAEVPEQGATPEEGDAPVEQQPAAVGPGHGTGRNPGDRPHGHGETDRHQPGRAYRHGPAGGRVVVGQHVRGEPGVTDEKQHERREQRPPEPPRGGLQQGVPLQAVHGAGGDRTADRQEQVRDRVGAGRDGQVQQVVDRAGDQGGDRRADITVRRTRVGGHAQCIGGRRRK
jgi:hypothetical protein